MIGFPIKAATLTLAMSLAPVAAHAQASSIEERLRALEQRQGELEQTLKERDAQIQQLEAERAAPAAAAQPGATGPSSVITLPTQTADSAESRLPAKGLGNYEFGKGFVLARGDVGELNLGMVAYARYLNQLDLNPTYTDSFGRTLRVDRREDVQMQKITMNFKGWLFDPNFRYLVFIWSANTSQGQGAQVVVAGNLQYTFNKHLTVGAGIGALPTTRTTMYTYPNWLRVDNRTFADDFMRGSYTSAIWAQGEIVDRLNYRVMVGNNLSQLGVDAGQLDPNFNTVSGALWWLPTTGEYGPGMGFGDFENHQEVATLFGASLTRSPEDAEAQPGVNDFENSQIRLSDGTRLFQPNAFNTGGQVTKATYTMFSLNAGMKYRGWTLDGQFFRRWVDDFEVIGAVPVDELNDHGFEIQASTMVIDKTLQLYASGSKIYGEYGDPSDIALGLNWFPFNRREVRINAQALYLNKSPVGGSSVPTVVGGDGWVFTTDAVLAF